MTDRIRRIRLAEERSHMQAYSQYSLFSQGSWLAKPVRSVMDLLPLYKGYSRFRALDLGCGVGRNCIPIAKEFSAIPCRIDCVDLLPLAIEKLRENAIQYGVEQSIAGIHSAIEDFSVPACTYDLILAVSSLEHMESEKALTEKLYSIRDGLRDGGAVCLIINSEVSERNAISGERMTPQFEVNLPAEYLSGLLHEVFASWSILNEKSAIQKYDIPRGDVVSHLQSTVITFAARKGDICK